MTNTTITNFRKNVFDYLNAVVSCNDIINVTTKEGNAVVVSAEEYNGLLETLFLTSVPGMKQQLVESLSEPLDTMTDAKEVDW